MTYYKHLSYTLSLASLLALISGCSGGGASSGTLPVAQTGSSPHVGTATTVNTASGPVTLSVAYITQSVQYDNGSIPLVVSQDAYLRIFPTTTQANVAQPTFIVNILENGTVSQSFTVQASGSTVPLSLNEGAWQSSANLLLPGTLMQPGLSYTISLQSNPGQILFKQTPSMAAPKTKGALEIVPLTEPKLLDDSFNDPNTMVAADINSANLPTYLRLFTQAIPLPHASYTLHTPLSIGFNLLPNPNIINNWNRANNIMALLRSTENNNSAFYYGVAGLQYSGGIEGDEFGSTAVVEDDTNGYGNPMLYSQRTLAHELGHVYGLMHSPCGGTTSNDPNFPNDAAHQNASIGSWGLNVPLTETGVPTLFDPATNQDIMSYCNEGWFSDYSYNKLISNNTVIQQSKQRQVLSTTSPPVSSPVPVVAIGGMIVNGQVTIDFSARINAPASTNLSGPYHLSGIGDNGQQLFNVAFTPDEDDEYTHNNGGREILAKPSGFYLTIPLNEAQNIASLNVTGPGIQPQSLHRSAMMASTKRQSLSLTRQIQTQVRGNGVDISWSKNDYQAALVSDSSGKLIGFLVNGKGHVVTNERSLKVQLTDGVDGVEQHVQAY